MFEELRRKFGRKTDEDAEFKPFEESTGNPTTAPTPERPAAQEPEHRTSLDASIESKNESVELRVIRPSAYTDVAQVADCLLDGCTVVLNLELVDRPTIVRMLDFLNGVTYCTDGEIKKVAQTTFIITPHANVDVSDV